MPPVLPTNLTWVQVDDCACPQPEAICVRPETYSKPIECLHISHLDAFAQHLIAKPCNNNNSNSSVLANDGPACCSGQNPVAIIFFMFILALQVLTDFFCLFYLFFSLSNKVALFWVIFVKVGGVRGPPSKHGRPRTPAGGGRRPPERGRRPRSPEGGHRPLAVFSVENMVGYRIPHP